MRRHVSRSLVIAVCSCALGAGAESAALYLDVPFVAQEKDGCGAAVIAMVMQYWQTAQHKPTTEDADAIKIQRTLFSQKAHGIYASDLEKYLKTHGFQTFTFAGHWEDFEKHLAKGRPLIVALKPPSHAPLHYVVIAGLEQSSGLVLLNDPAQRKLLKQSRQTFEQAWKAAGNWTLLALPGEAAPSAR